MTKVTNEKSFGEVVKFETVTKYYVQKLVGPTMMKMMAIGPVKDAPEICKWYIDGPKFKTSCYRFFHLVCQNYGYKAVQQDKEFYKDILEEAVELLRTPFNIDDWKA